MRLRESVGRKEDARVCSLTTWVEGDATIQGREGVYLAGKALRLLWDMLCLQCLSNIWVDMTSKQLGEIWP